MIRVQKPAAGPRILSGAQNRGPKATKKLKEAFDRGERDFDFSSSIYGAKSVKNKLIEIQNDKCCFCESRITHVDFGDVEHFRPKAAFIQNVGDPLSKPGYYWLAYEWSNLFLSCALCNQRFKRSLFPLLDPQKRARSHHDDVSREQPVFVNPMTDDPGQFIGFRDEHPFGKDNDGRGENTIKLLGIERDELEEMRRARLAEAKLIHRTAKLLRQLKTRDGALEPALESLLQEHETALTRFKEPETEYQAMLRAAEIIP